MAYFPVFIEMKNKTCLVVGGGRIATRKIKTILSYGANVKVIAPKICDEIKQYAKENINLDMQEREFAYEDCEGMFLVIGATNDIKLNKNIYRYCNQRNILVNIINGKDFCTFLFPSTIRRKDISIGITTSGKSPALAKAIRKQIEENLPSHYGELNEILGWAREYIIGEIGEERKRRRIFSHLIELGTKQNKLWTREEILEIIRREKND
ncbi:MAG: bifunctional precorrin-2 dehydrogenase/sirohydrochlorin ferrochelatase [Lachnospiraceae bacterium]